MSDDDRLLAYLVSSFPGRTEDIATEALCHVFGQSDACVDALAWRGPVRRARH